MNKSLLVLSLLACTTLCVAQPKVENTDANPAGKSIAITYDLSEKAHVLIYVSEDDGQTYQRIPQRYLSGECGNRVEPGQHRKALWHVLDQRSGDFEGDLRFRVKARPVFSPFILATGSYAFASAKPINNLAGGLMLGGVSTVGFYLRGEYSFTQPKTCAYTVDAMGKLDGMLPTYTGQTASRAWQATGGLMVRMYIPLYIYLGGGYGQRDLYCETLDKANPEWVLHQGGTYHNWVGDIGLMANIHHFALSAGVSTIGLKYTTVHVGIGCIF